MYKTIQNNVIEKAKIVEKYTIKIHYPNLKLTY